MRDIREFIPKNEGDVERARAAVEAGYPFVEPILGELIAWLKEGNCPVARILEPFLQTVGAPLILHIRDALTGDDLTWKLKVIRRLIPTLPREIAAEFHTELDRLCYEPSATERNEELDDAARTALIDFDWLRPGKRAELMRILEERFRPRLHEYADQLRAANPDCRIHVTSSPVGSRTEYQAHALAIDCLLPNIPYDETDDVALSIIFTHLDRDAKLHADVCWGSGDCELDFREGWRNSDEWPLATPETLDELEAILPALFHALRTALNRRRPPYI